MTVLIVEDEILAANQLKRFIKDYDPQINILPVADSIREAVEVLLDCKPDLIFMDIQLADGLSFDIFRLVDVQSPVIFTTAYDHYAVEAFKVNSVDYLLKPIQSSAIENAFGNFEAKKQFFSNLNQKQNVANSAKSTNQSYKERFLVKVGNKLIPVEESEINHFFAEDKWTYLVTRMNKKYIVNYTLTELETLLDPGKYFRLNRQFTVPKSSILSLETYFKGQVIAKIRLLESEKIVVSRQQTPLLKQWMGE